MRRGDGEAGLLITMHNQHRSPDPTKIERATATSTVALFFNFFLKEEGQNMYEKVKHGKERRKKACVLWCPSKKNFVRRRWIRG
jgi:hypothetical protein